MSALIAAGAALAGGAIGRAGQQDTNAANARMAHEQMAFQERMAGSAHQRQVADLRAAGLNPILSGTGGSGSATPPGASATMGNELGAGLSSAMETRQKNREDRIGKHIEDASRNKASQAQAESQMAWDQESFNHALYRSGEWRADVGHYQNTIDLADAERQRLIAGARLQANSARQSDIETKAMENIGVTGSTIQRGAGVVGSVIDAVNPLRGALRGALSGGAPSSARRAEPALRQESQPRGRPAPRRPYKVDQETGEIREIKTHPR